MGDLRHIEEVGPSGLYGGCQLKPGRDEHGFSLLIWLAPWRHRDETAGTLAVAGLRAPVAPSLRQDTVIGVPGSTRWIQVRPGGRCIGLPSAPRILSGCSALVRSHFAV